MTITALQQICVYKHKYAYYLKGSEKKWAIPKSGHIPLYKSSLFSVVAYKSSNFSLGLSKQCKSTETQLDWCTHIPTYKPWRVVIVTRKNIT